jgi:hypothetical protein
LPRLSRSERLAIARKRIISVLDTNTVCLARTLEQKIADAGPGHLRVDPHLITTTLRQLLKENAIAFLERGHGNARWYYLSTTPPRRRHSRRVQERLNTLLPLHDAFSTAPVSHRVGQAAEIAVCRALSLRPASLQFFGAFSDLEEHADSQLYSKEEPLHIVSGRKTEGGLLDFIVIHPSAGIAGIEVKNIRQWLYPSRTKYRRH